MEYFLETILFTLELYSLSPANLVSIFYPQAGRVTSPSNCEELMWGGEQLKTRRLELAVKCHGALEVFLLLQLVDGGSQLLHHHHLPLKLTCVLGVDAHHLVRWHVVERPR